MRTSESTEATEDAGRPRPSAWRRVAPWLVLALLGGVWILWEVLSPHGKVLLPDGRAQWIQKFRESELRRFDYRPRRVLFRRQLQLPTAVPRSGFRLAARDEALLFVDGARIERRGPEALVPGRAWADELPPMSAGTHQILVVVASLNCHPSMVFRSDPLGIVSDGSWEASLDGSQWTPTKLVRELRTPALSMAFPSAPRALLETTPFLALLALAAAAVLLLARRNRWSWPRAARVRWVLLGIWAVLCLNNLAKLRLGLGMDSEDHLAYIAFLAERHGLPLATEGLQMFQPPLYYVLSLPLWWLAQALGGGRALGLLSLLPMLCGALQIELAHRTLAAVFPDREDLKIAGTAVAGFLPINLYMSQFPGNEPVAGVFGALAVSLWTTWITTRQSSHRFTWKLGLALGLALLSKATAVLLVAGFLLHAALRRWDVSRRKADLRLLAPAALLAALVAGGYYLRNWVLLGRPFVGGWDPARGDAWWQDPGLVPVSALYGFGAALLRPVYAQIHGFLDGLYATFALDAGLSGMAGLAGLPPWNYRLLLSCALLVLVPLAIMALGAVRERHRPAVSLAALLVAGHVAAILHLYVGPVPTYSTLKASYLLGLTPCFGVLVAAGLAALPDRAWIRNAACGALFLWVACAASSYFVL